MAEGEDKETGLFSVAPSVPATGSSISISKLEKEELDWEASVDVNLLHRDPNLTGLTRGD